jgi:hypothetical protein
VRLCVCVCVCVCVSEKGDESKRGKWNRTQKRPAALKEQHNTTAANRSTKHNNLKGSATCQERLVGLGEWVGRLGTLSCCCIIGGEERFFKNRTRWREERKGNGSGRRARHPKDHTQSSGAPFTLSVGPRLFSLAATKPSRLPFLFLVWHVVDLERRETCIYISEQRRPTPSQSRMGRPARHLCDTEGQRTVFLWGRETARLLTHTYTQYVQSLTRQGDWGWGRGAPSTSFRLASNHSSDRSSRLPPAVRSALTPPRLSTPSRTRTHPTITEGGGSRLVAGRFPRCFWCLCLGRGGSRSDRVGKRRQQQQQRQAGFPL